MIPQCAPLANDFCDVAAQRETHVIRVKHLLAIKPGHTIDLTLWLL